MKKLLFVTAAALGIASQAFAINPTNSFYVPKKGNFMFRGDAAWTRAQDTTGTDTYTSIDGMYGLTNGIALIAGVYENPALLNAGTAFLSDATREGAARIPEVGIKFVPCLKGGFKLAAEAAYGFGSYGSDGAEHDYIRTKLTVGKKVGNFIFGAFADYAHFYRFSKNSIEVGRQWRVPAIHNANFYGGGLVGTYNVSDKTTVDLTWRHSFKEQFRVRYTDVEVGKMLGTKAHYKDSVRLSATYEFRDGAYFTPYVGYNWVDKGASRGDRNMPVFPRNTTLFGANLAFEF